MKVYLDNSATTPLDKDVLDTMIPYFCDVYGNANSLHSFGRSAGSAVDTAREQVASAISCKKSEVYFTSGGTESDNWAIKGIAKSNCEKGNHIIVSKIEHSAILAAARQLEKDGYKVSYIDVDNFGVVKIKDILSEITDKTILVSIMMANNEIGTLQPIKEIVQKVKAVNPKIYVHTDAVQAIGSVSVNVDDLGVDLLSLSAHKFYGPKGVGVLYVRTGVKIDKLVVGGHQERTMRGGTSNVAGIAGLGMAILKATKDINTNAKEVARLRDYFTAKVIAHIPDITFNGHPRQKLCSNCNISFAGVEGESILQLLDLQGIAVSTGSACSSGSLEPSHVLLATGVSIENAHGSIRFSFGKHNTLKEIDYVVPKLKETIERLRAMSPIYNPAK